MKKTKIVSMDVEVIDDMICNMCGKSLKKYMDRDNEVFNYCGLEEVSMVCGYESVNDGTTFTFSLCEKCVYKLMKKFKLPVETTNIFGNSDE